MRTAFPGVLLPKFVEPGVQVIGRRYYFCPLCRLDFVDDIRVHLLSCAVIAAALEQRIARSQHLVKERERLILSSAVLAAESQALAHRVLDTMRASRHAPPPSPPRWIGAVEAPSD